MKTYLIFLLSILLLGCPREIILPTEETEQSSQPTSQEDVPLPASHTEDESTYTPEIFSDKKGDLILQTEDRTFQFDLVKKFDFDNGSGTFSTVSQQKNPGEAGLLTSHDANEATYANSLATLTGGNDNQTSLAFCHDNEGKFADGTYDYIEISFKASSEASQIKLESGNSKEYVFSYQSGQLNISKGDTSYGTMETAYQDSSTDFTTIGFYNNLQGDGCLLVENQRASYIEDFSSTAKLNWNTGFSYIVVSGASVDIDYVAFYKKRDLEIQTYAAYGYDQLKLHGKFREYKVDKENGDSDLYWCKGALYSDGVSCSCCTNGVSNTIPEGTIVDGIEKPTYWSRLPLSIRANNADTKKGLYSIHAKGTSLIFPKNQANLEFRADGNMRQRTAGVYIAFESDCDSIRVDGEYWGVDLSLRSYTGLDLYKKQDNEWKHIHTFKDSDKNEFLDQTYSTNSNGTTGQYILMLPTYNGFKFNSENAPENPSGLRLIFGKFGDNPPSFGEIEPFNESQQDPILIYGTSITQGDGADSLRPGAAYTAQIMWKTQREVINCGFAGSAQIEYKMADFLANIKSSVFVIDPGWNLTGGQGGGSITLNQCDANGAPANISNTEIIERTKYMVKTYRKAHPNTPIIICPMYLKASDTKQTAWPTWTTAIDAPDNFNPNNYLYGRPSFLLYKAYYDLINDSTEPVEKLYWAEQGAKDSVGPFVDGSNLHPGEQGMTDIAEFILKAIKEAAPSIYND